MPENTLLEPKSPYKAPFNPSNAQFPKEITIQQGQEYSSRTISNMDFVKDQVICNITQATIMTKASWTTVQIAKDKHVELNSELVYLNHSCEPTIKIDVEKMQVVALKDIKVGDELVFFYPSTEFDMDQGFKCWCNSSSCVGIVRGAKYLSKSQQTHFDLQPHIREMLLKV